MSRTIRLRLAVPEGFQLRTTVFGHGWVSLAPFQWDEGRGELFAPISTRGGPADVWIRRSASGLSVKAERRRAFGARARVEIQEAVTRMLRLDEDMSELFSLCRREPRLRWVPKIGAGRLLRAPTLFEDLIKLLFTTNCSWAATKKMAERLTENLGAETPSGARAFPTAECCAAQDERLFREEIRAGYRSGRCVSLAEGFASGRFSVAELESTRTPTDELRDRLHQLPGFGPYAAGQAMRLLGRYDDLALDSMCRAKLARIEGRSRPRSDRAIERAYRGYGSLRGLVLWLDLTADWHTGAAPELSSIFGL